MKQLDNLTFVPYSEQIKSPKWQKKRLEILQLHNFKCEECGSETKTLNVHHRFYIKGRKIHEYDNDVLQCLCEDCHAKVHKKKEVVEVLNPKLNYIFSTLKQINEVNYSGIGAVLSEIKSNENIFKKDELWVALFQCFNNNIILDVLKLINEKIEYAEMKDKLNSLELNFNHHLIK